MNLQPVEVEWIDAQSSLESQYIEDLAELEPLVTHSCGYLAHEDKDKLILCFMVFGDVMAKHYQIIPRSMVRKIRRLKVIKK